MSTNREDIERGREMIESGEAVRYDQLREGDRIIGVGVVEYVHVHNGGEFVHVRAGGVDHGRKRAELKVSVDPGTDAAHKRQGAARHEVPALVIARVADLRVGDLWRRRYGDPSFAEVLAVRRMDGGKRVEITYRNSKTGGIGYASCEADLPAERRLTAIDRAWELDVAHAAHLAGEA